MKYKNEAFEKYIKENSDMSNRAIAKELGVSEKYVRTTRDRLGLSKSTKTGHFEKGNKKSSSYKEEPKNVIASFDINPAEMDDTVKDKVAKMILNSESYSRSTKEELLNTIYGNSDKTQALMRMNSIVESDNHTDTLSTDKATGFPELPDGRLSDGKIIAKEILKEQKLSQAEKTDDYEELLNPFTDYGCSKDQKHGHLSKWERVEMQATGKVSERDKNGNYNSGFGHEPYFDGNEAGNNYNSYYTEKATHLQQANGKLKEGNLIDYGYEWETEYLVKSTDLQAPAETGKHWITINGNHILIDDYI